MTDYKDPLEDPAVWRNDTTFTVVALLQHRPTSRPVVSAVKLAKAHDDAQDELKRMIDAVTERAWRSGTPAKAPTFTMERGLSWARVEFSDGIVYAFSIQKAIWAPKPGPAKLEAAHQAGKHDRDRLCHCDRCNRAAVLAPQRRPSG